ncbi:MAG: hypothetical protein CL861_05665 [Cyanobium sp. MED843]|nr:hypothetical protein [Cyanobium sp. MED843]|tara:strand:- start:174 stop:443 length:270 start_codon:yes stop_codon:yes gene_type:complete
MMDKADAAQMMEDMQKRFPGLTPEVAAQTFLCESLRACRSVMDLARLPIDPSVINQLRDRGLLDQEEWQRLMLMLDPASVSPTIDGSGE